MSDAAENQAELRTMQRHGLSKAFGHPVAFLCFSFPLESLVNISNFRFHSKGTGTRLESSCGVHDRGRVQAIVIGGLFRCDSLD